MSTRFIRGLTADSGDLQRLLLVLRCVHRLRSGEDAELREAFREAMVHDGSKQRKSSSWAPRSAEPHIRLARNLDLFDDEGITPLGRAILMIGDTPSVWKQRPVILLAVFLQRDLAYSSHLLRALGINGSPAEPEEVHLRDAAMSAYRSFWRESSRAGFADLPDPSDWKAARPRTALHYATARMRFFEQPEGLGLERHVLRRLGERLCGLRTETSGTDDELRLLDHLLVIVHESIAGSTPPQIDTTEIEATCSAILASRHETYGALTGFMAASGMALYLIVNHHLLAERGHWCGAVSMREALLKAGYRIYQGREPFRGRNADAPGPRFADFLVQAPQEK